MANKKRRRSESFQAEQSGADDARKRLAAFHERMFELPQEEAAVAAPETPRVTFKAKKHKKHKKSSGPGGDEDDGEPVPMVKFNAKPKKAKAKTKAPVAAAIGQAKKDKKVMGPAVVKVPGLSSVVKSGALKTKVVARVVKEEKKKTLKQQHATVQTVKKTAKVQVAIQAPQWHSMKSGDAQEDDDGVDPLEQALGSMKELVTKQDAKPPRKKHKSVTSKADAAMETEKPKGVEPTETKAVESAKAIDETMNVDVKDDLGKQSTQTMTKSKKKKMKKKRKPLLKQAALKANDDKVAPQTPVVVSKQPSTPSSASNKDTVGVKSPIPGGVHGSATNQHTAPSPKSPGSRKKRKKSPKVNGMIHASPKNIVPVQPRKGKPLVLSDEPTGGGDSNTKSVKGTHTAVSKTAKIAPVLKENTEAAAPALKTPKIVPALKENTEAAAPALKTPKIAPAQKENTKEAAPALKTKEAAPALKTPKIAPVLKENTEAAAPALKTPKIAPAQKENTKEAAPALKTKEAAPALKTPKIAPAQKENTKAAAPALKNNIAKVEMTATKEAKFTKPLTPIGASLAKDTTKKNDMFLSVREVPVKPTVAPTHLAKAAASPVLQMSEESSESDEESDVGSDHSDGASLFSRLIDSAARERWELVEVGRLVRLFAAEWGFKEGKTASFLLDTCPELVSVDFLEGLGINLSAKHLMQVFEAGSGKSGVLVNKMASALENGHLSVHDPSFVSALERRVALMDSNAEVMELLHPLMESMSTVRDVGCLLKQLCEHWQLERKIALVQQVLLSNIFDDLDGNQDDILLDLPDLTDRLDFPSRLDQEDVDENGNLKGFLANEDSEFSEVEGSEDELDEDDSEEEEEDPYEGETDSEEETEITGRPRGRNQFIEDEADVGEEDEEEEEEDEEEEEEDEEERQDDVESSSSDSD